MLTQMDDMYFVVTRALQLIRIIGDDGYRLYYTVLNIQVTLHKLIQIRRSIDNNTDETFILLFVWISK